MDALRAALSLAVGLFVVTALGQTPPIATATGTAPATATLTLTPGAGSVSGFNIYCAASQAGLPATPNQFAAGATDASCFGHWCGTGSCTPNTSATTSTVTFANLSAGSYFYEATQIFCPTAGSVAGCQESLPSNVGLLTVTAPPPAPSPPTIKSITVTVTVSQ